MTGAAVHAIGFVAGAVTGSVFTYRRVARLANDIIADVERQAQLRLDRARQRGLFDIAEAAPA